MSKKSRQRRREARQNRTRAQRTRWSVLAGLAVVVVVGGVLAVRASGGNQPASLHLYQGQQQLGASGDTIDLADVVGHGEPTVVNFWASNCPPCRMEMPGFQRVYAQHFGQGYRMLGIDVGPQTGLGTHAGAQALIAQLGIQYPVGYAEDNTLVARYGLRGMPTTMFFDASGKVVGKVVGYLPEATLRQRLAGLLAGGS